MSQIILLSIRSKHVYFENLQQWELLELKITTKNSLLFGTTKF